MKFFLALTVLLLNSAFVTPIGITKWGQSGVGIATYKVVYIENLSYEPLDYAFPFPERDGRSLIIHGVTHLDFNADARTQISFVEGGIGQGFVKVNMTTMPGQSIHSSVVFHITFNEVSDAPVGPQSVDEFFESNVNIDFDIN